MLFGSKEGKLGSGSSVHEARPMDANGDREGYRAPEIHSLGSVRKLVQGGSEGRRRDLYTGYYSRA